MTRTNIMPYGWNLFQGNGGFELYINEVILPILRKGKWYGREYIEFVNNLIRKYGKPELNVDIEEYTYEPLNKPAYWDKEYSNIMVMYKEITDTKSFRNWATIMKRHFVYLPKGIAFEEQIATLNPNWARTDSKMDYESGIDFIDYEHKVLWSVKCSKTITIEHTEKLKKYFSETTNKLKWKGFKVKILWHNTENESTFVIEAGEVE